MRYWMLALILFGLMGCLPEENPQDARSFSMDDPKVREIYDAQDRRSAADLEPFLSDEQANYRYLATLAAASMQDSTLIYHLSGILQSDPFPSTRLNAAYALGQTGTGKAADIITSSFKKETSREVQSAMLAAIGRTGNDSHLQYLSEIKTYGPEDTLLLEGLSKAFFYFALRGITQPASTKKVIDLLLIPNLSPEARLYCATYLQRAANIDLTPHEANLIKVVKREENPNVKMFLVMALGRTGSEGALTALKSEYEKTSDYRVKTNLLRTLSNFTYEDVRETVLAAALDSIDHVALTAAGYLKNNGDVNDGSRYYELSNETKSWRVRAELLAAVLNNLPYRSTITKDFFSGRIKDLYSKSENPYEKAALLTALQYHGFNYAYIANELFQPQHVAIRTAAIQSLTSIRAHQEFNRMFGTRANYARRELDIYLQQAIEDGDVALVGTVAGHYRNPDLDYANRLDSLDFLIKAKEQLALPKEMETFIELEKTIQFLSGQPVDAHFTPEYNHPIDWNVLSVVPDSSLAVIQTPKGKITIRLFSKLAPGSVANFAGLAKSGFYDRKNVHRVVPNFVVQGGCPRGDGWGSMDYSIRSELGPGYYNKPGYIGMASAGKDTEGTQWFITHSPTPHLDGRYTIFGEVTDGMDVVHALQVGDQIESVQIKAK